MDIILSSSAGLMESGWPEEQQVWILVPKERNHGAPRHTDTAGGKHRGDWDES